MEEWTARSACRAAGSEPGWGGVGSESEFGPGKRPAEPVVAVPGRGGGRRLGRRLVQLYLGLALYGTSMALFVQAGLGVMPWDVLHQGLARRTHLSIGTMAIAVGALVLLLWIPLRQRPGIGTASNVIVIGLALDAALRLLPPVGLFGWRIACLVAGLLLNAVATAAYLGAGLGPGPRDGLMTGAVRRFGWSVRLVRTGIEVGVVAAGWLLGGNLGIGTVLYAVAIGPLVHPLLPRLAVRAAPSATTAPPVVPAPAVVPAARAIPVDLPTTAASPLP